MCVCFMAWQGNDEQTETMACPDISPVLITTMQAQTDGSNHRLVTNVRCGFRKALSSPQEFNVIRRMCERSPMSHAVSDAQPETRESQAETSGRRALAQRGPRAFQDRNSAPTSLRRRSKGICLQPPRKPPEDSDQRKYLCVPLVLEWPIDRTSQYRLYIEREAACTR
jgi:hypothetical protein